MTSAAATQSQDSRIAWIISPAADVLFFLVTPVAALILAWVLDASLFDEATLVLALGAVASGHHVPGFIRTYSDPELRSLYSFRLFFAPILLVVGCLWFTFQRIPGLELLLIPWGLWHFLMQNYGIMRIYGAKKGDISRSAARLDWLVMFTCVGATYVTNPAWSYKLQFQLFNFGVPVKLAGAYQWFQSGIGYLAIIVAIIYFGNAFRRFVTGAPVNVLKYILVASTILFFSVGFGFTANVLFVTIMAELVHDLQYYALAWSFQRRLSHRQRGNRSIVPSMFRTVQVALLAYIALSLCYGSVFSNVLRQHLDSRGSLAQALVGVLYAMTLFHFYSDGFIWKVRQPKTRQYLGIEALGDTATAVPENHQVRTGVRSLLHLACYLFFFGGAWLLHPQDDSRSMLVAITLAEVHPEDGHAHHVLGQEYLQKGQNREAVWALELALRLGVQKEAELRQRLATAHVENGDYVRAIAVLGEGADRIPVHQSRKLLGQLALILAQCPHQILRDGVRAVELATKACPGGGRTRPYYLDILVSAHIEAGQWSDAEKVANGAYSEAEAINDSQLVARISNRQAAIRRRQKYPTD